MGNMRLTRGGVTDCQLKDKGGEWPQNTVQVHVPRITEPFRLPATHSRAHRLSSQSLCAPTPHSAHTPFRTRGCRGSPASASASPFAAAGSGSGCRTHRFEAPWQGCQPSPPTPTAQPSAVARGRMWKYGDTEIWEYGDTETRKHGNMEIRKYRSTEIRKCGNTEIRKYGNTEIRKYGNMEKRKHRNTEIRKYGNTEIWQIRWNAETNDTP